MVCVNCGSRQNVRKVYCWSTQRSGARARNYNGGPGELAILETVEDQGCTRATSLGWCLIYSYISPLLVPDLCPATLPSSQLVGRALSAPGRVHLVLLLPTAKFRLHSKGPGRQVRVGGVAKVLHLEAVEVGCGFLARGVGARW